MCDVADQSPLDERVVAEIRGIYTRLTKHTLVGMLPMLASLTCLLLCHPQETKAEPSVPPDRPLAFALAKSNKDGQSIAITMPPGQRLATYVVNVKSTRTIEDENGKQRQVTATHRENRLYYSRTGTPVGTREEAFQVMRPETRTRVKNGVKETFVLQVPALQTVAFPIYGETKPVIHKQAECTITDINGKAVDTKEITTRLKTKSPIVILARNQKLPPFYKAALNPRILLVTPPLPDRNARPAPLGEE